MSRKTPEVAPHIMRYPGGATIDGLFSKPFEHREKGRKLRSKEKKAQRVR